MRFADIPQTEECIYYTRAELVPPPPEALAPLGLAALGAPAAILADPAPELVQVKDRFYRKRRRPCIRANKAWRAEHPLGRVRVVPVAEGKFTHLLAGDIAVVGWLNSCAAVFYIFDRGAAGVAVVAVHALTGIFKGTKKDTPLPSECNEHGVAAASITVVFATPCPDTNINTWGEGIGQLLNDGIPSANIKVIYGVEGDYTGTGVGTFGESALGIWPRGNLIALFDGSADAALVRYEAQFPRNKTKLRFPFHNQADGRTRTASLKRELAAARHSTDAIAVMRRFFANTGRSFKANSLKRLLVDELNMRLAAARVITSDVTAAAAAREILDRLLDGRL